MQCLKTYWKKKLKILSIISDNSPKHAEHAEVTHFEQILSKSVLGSSDVKSNVEDYLVLFNMILSKLHIFFVKTYSME